MGCPASRTKPQAAWLARCPVRLRDHSITRTWELVRTNGQPAPGPTLNLLRQTLGVGPSDLWEQAPQVMRAPSGRNSGLGEAGPQRGQHPGGGGQDQAQAPGASGRQTGAGSSDPGLAAPPSAARG